jgi:ubiquinone/menaquinone biosynthesis C-methylase UbiE
MIDWNRRYLLQARWTSDLRGYLRHRLKAHPPASMLEVGCGTGAVLREFVNEAPNEIPGLVCGLDIDAEALSLAANALPKARLVEADGTNLPFADRIFDLTYCHFLLLWVADPLNILLEMCRVTRPGGAVAAMAEPDYTARIDYPDELVELGELQRQALQNQGVNPSIGRQLRSLFLRSGLREVEAGVLGGQWRLTADTTEFESEWSLLRQDLSNSAGDKRLQELYQADLRAWQSGERILYVPVFYAMGFV